MSVYVAHEVGPRPLRRPRLFGLLLEELANAREVLGGSEVLVPAAAGHFPPFRVQFAWSDSSASKEVNERKKERNEPVVWTAELLDSRFPRVLHAQHFVDVVVEVADFELAQAGILNTR